MGTGFDAEDRAVQVHEGVRADSVDIPHRASQEALKGPCRLSADPADIGAQALDKPLFVDYAKLRLAIYVFYKKMGWGFPIRRLVIWRCAWS